MNFFKFCEIAIKLDEIKDDLQRLQVEILEIKQCLKEDCQNIDTPDLLE